MSNHILKNVSKETFLLYYTFKYFLLFQLIFGYNYDFIDINSIKLKYLIKLASLLTSSIMSIMLIKYTIHLDDSIKNSYYLFLFEYICAIIILLTSKSKFSTFFKEFNYIDVKLTLHSKKYICLLLITIFIVTITLCLKCIASFKLCYVLKICNESVINLILTSYPIIAVDILHITNFIYSTKSFKRND